MKRFVLALVAAALLVLNTAIPAAESGTTNPAPVKPKPLTAADIKKAEANKKKVEWWQLPPTPVPPPISSGGSHAGH